MYNNQIEEYEPSTNSKRDYRESLQNAMSTPLIDFLNITPKRSSTEKKVRQ